MTSDLSGFREKFQVDELEIAHTDHWVFSLRPVQSTLGAGILSLRRFCPSFGDASAREMADLAGITATIERRLKATFAPDKLNYLMLMMVDAHLHFHVIPRYSHAITFDGRAWEDTTWPGVPEVGEVTPLTSSSLARIRDALRE